MIEIENELKANSTECIVKSVYDSYRSKTLNLVEESTKSFKTACEYVALNATENIVEVQYSGSRYKNYFMRMCRTNRTRYFCVS